MIQYTATEKKLNYFLFKKEPRSNDQFLNFLATYLQQKHNRIENNPIIKVIRHPSASPSLLYFTKNKDGEIYSQEEEKKRNLFNSFGEKMEKKEIKEKEILWRREAKSMNKKTKFYHIVLSSKLKNDEKTNRIFDARINEFLSQNFCDLDYVYAIHKDGKYPHVHLYFINNDLSNRSVFFNIEKLRGLKADYADFLKSTLNYRTYLTERISKQQPERNQKNYGQSSYLLKYKIEPGTNHDFLRFMTYLKRNNSDFFDLILKEKESKKERKRIFNLFQEAQKKNALYRILFNSGLRKKEIFPMMQKLERENEDPYKVIDRIRLKEDLTGVDPQNLHKAFEF